MVSSSGETAQIDLKGLRRLAYGAGAGVAGGFIGIVIPLALIELIAFDPSGAFAFSTESVQFLGILVIIGAILLLISLFFYRRSFAALRKVDPRFTWASILCLVGSLGFLLLVIAAAVIFGSSSSLVACVQGEPSHALTCLRSGQPLGAYTGLAGFWLSWLGGVGLVLGLTSAGRRFHQAAIYAGGLLYGILLVVLVGPFLAQIATIPFASYLVLATPIVLLLAPAAVLGGAARRTPP